LAAARAEIPSYLLETRMLRPGLLALWVVLVGCQVSVRPYEDRACDKTHPCLEGSGRECVRGTCQLPWDGGTAPWPDETTTGVIPGIPLTPSGSVRITDAGVVLESLDIHGCVEVDADDVTLRNLRIRGGETCTGSLLDLNDAKRTLVEDVEIDGTAHSSNLYAIVGADFTLRRVHLHDAASGIRTYGDNITVEHSLFHKLTSTTGAGAFVSSGGSNHRLVHNALEVEGPGDAVINLVVIEESFRDVRVESNLLNGGGWTIVGGGGNASMPSSNLHFSRNRFGRKFHPRCGSYGPVTSFESNGPGNVWEDNAFEDDGEAVNP
jgi:hypothetical protein